MTFGTGIWSEETRHLTADYLADYRISGQTPIRVSKYPARASLNTYEC